ncbi:hypothetical protein RSAG8_13820, partial [Rhizoctonia solani AG-8 WAC10335]
MSNVQVLSDVNIGGKTRNIDISNVVYVWLRAPSSRCGDSNTGIKQQNTLSV